MTSGREYLPSIFKDSKKKNYDATFKIETISDQLESSHHRNEEIKKKDDVIKKLCNIHELDAKFRGGHSTCNTHFDANRSEFATMSVKIDNLEDKLRRQGVELDTKNEALSVTKKELEIARCEIDKLSRENKRLTDQIDVGDKDKATWESLKYRSDFAVKSLQEQYSNSQSRVAELEARIKTQLMEKEKSAQANDNLDRKFKDFLVNVSRLVTEVPDFNDTDAILEKLQEMSQQNGMLQGKLHACEEELKTTKDDADSAKQTISRLMGDYGGIGKNHEEIKSKNSHLKLENDDLKQQISLLENRLESLQKLQANVYTEMEEKSKKMLQLEVDVKEKDFSKDSAERQYSSLLESLAAFIGTPYLHCSADEASVKARVKDLVQVVKQQSSAAETLDARVLSLQKQFESQYTSGKDLISRVEEAEVEVKKQTEKCNLLEQDVKAKEIINEGQKLEKMRLLKNFQRFSELLNLDYALKDEDAGDLIEAIEERIREVMEGCSCHSTCNLHNNRNHSQICKASAREPLNSSRSQTQTRRIVDLKEKLEEREAQIVLLEKQLDQNYKCNCCEVMTSRDKLSQVQKQLDESNLEIDCLKKLLKEKDKKMLNTEEIDRLATTVDKLEQVRQRQAKKIAKMEAQLSNQEKGQQDSRVDLKQARKLLEMTRDKEKRATEFMWQAARLLHVDMRCSPNPAQEMLNKMQSCANLNTSLATSQQNSFVGLNGTSNSQFHPMIMPPPQLNNTSSIMPPSLDFAPQLSNQLTKSNQMSDPYKDNIQKSVNNSNRISNLARRSYSGQTSILKKRSSSADGHVDKRQY